MKINEILKSKENLNIPNLLSALRIVMIGAIVVFFTKDMYYYAFFTYILASLTDLVDGYVARKYNMITPLGKLLDPLADKLMLISVTVCMYMKGWIPLWILIVILGKELLQIVGGVIMYSHKDTVVQANIMGKLTTVLFSISIGLLFLHQYVAPYDTYAIIFTVIFAVVTLVQYFYLYITNTKKNAMPQSDNPVDNNANNE